MEYPDRTIVSSETIVIDKTFEYIQRDHDIKPAGLWYGIKNSWITFWFDDELMDTMTDKVINEIIINDDKFTHDIDTPDANKILVLDSLKDIQMFSEKYRFNKKDPYRTFLKWSNFSKDFGGIEVRNYRDIGFDRLDYIWLSSFDCSCGCVWNLSLLDYN
jgi:hypothetical protein